MYLYKPYKEYVNTVNALNSRRILIEECVTFVCKIPLLARALGLKAEQCSR